ncbi:MAG: hypothetical protein GY773_23875, partial [Actinomycetia bacterium]|nr:hypothetical protein [Actinomycetes bacterium]
MHGVVCRADIDGNLSGYFLAIGGEGRYEIGAFDGHGNYEVLIEGVAPAA